MSVSKILKVSSIMFVHVLLYDCSHGSACERAVSVLIFTTEVNVLMGQQKHLPKSLSHGPLMCPPCFLLFLFCSLTHTLPHKQRCPSHRHAGY